ncbi:MAG TPA: ATP-dependent DNA helicase RecG, partial [bacterium]|nr:ATP-dependent DNA helicase RecG [bacterium]
INPKFKTVNFEKYKHGAIIVRPVYSLPERINYANFKKVLDTALNIYLPIMTDYLSSKIIKNKNFLKLTECLEFLHNPSDIQKISEYRRQMLFRNFYFFQFIIQSNRVTITKLKCAAFDYGKAADKIKKLINSLNFSLTKSQQKTFNEILNDISKDTPMRRLLQGDVGSGKTIIAILSTIVCVENNCQAVIMCPSELLAHQHYNTFLKFLEFANYRICLLTSAISKKTREILLEKISGGEIDIIIGTHSIIQKDVNFYKVGLVVIDEQHRFGVKQRLLAVKHSTNPHLLYMTATPIPRTLGLTIFSDFDISVISEKPRNRKKIITKIITEKEEEALFANIRKNAENGFQTFIVYPVIDESSKRELKSVKMRFEKLSNTVFKDINCAMLHSKINDEQRVNIMNDFVSNKIKILFSTTIIEIGIDIPNANMMIIEHPECFGLAQLHQLRGRIGRNPIQSYCYLIISENLSTLSKQRIEKFTELDDGLALAEFDLQNRGCGDFIGERQSGLSENFIKDFFKHTDLMLEVKKIVFEILRNSDFKTKYLYLKKQMIFRK